MCALQAAAKANEGSAWNHAGTFEERMFTKWAEVPTVRSALSATAARLFELN